VIRCYPEPYIICETKDESYLNCIEYNGVLLSTSYLSCTYVMSQPTGYNNLSVSEAFQNKYNHNPKLTVDTGKSARAMLEEKDRQMNIIGGRPQGVTGYIDGSTALRIKPKKSPSMERETQGTALAEENVADLIGAGNAEQDATVLAVHNAAADGKGSVGGKVLDADKGADDVPE